MYFIKKKRRLTGVKNECYRGIFYKDVGGP